MSSRRTLLAVSLLIAFFAFVRGKIKLWARIKLGKVMNTRLRRRSQPWPTRTSRVSLIIAPHQDDGALGCGGLVARRVMAGEIVHVAYLTDGSASHPGHPEFTPAMIAALRADEARVATGILGVPGINLSFLKAPDGQLPHLDAPARADLVKRLQTLIERTAPSEIFITSRHDGSSEHTAANELVREAIARATITRPRLLEYIVWSRWSPLILRNALRRSAPAIYSQPLSAKELELKHNAIRAYRSQVEPLAPWSHSVLPANFTMMFRDREEFYFEF